MAALRGIELPSKASPPLVRQRPTFKIRMSGQGAATEGRPYSTFRVDLIATQGLNGIDLCCASCRNARGDERDGDDEGCHEKVDQGIGRAYGK